MDFGNATNKQVQLGRSSPCHHPPLFVQMVIFSQVGVLKQSETPHLVLLQIIFTWSHAKLHNILLDQSQSSCNKPQPYHQLPFFTITSLMFAGLCSLGPVGSFPSPKLIMDQEVSEGGPHWGADLPFPMLGTSLHYCTRTGSLRIRLCILRIRDYPDPILWHGNGMD